MIKTKKLLIPLLCLMLALPLLFMLTACYVLGFIRPPSSDIGIHLPPMGDVDDGGYWQEGDQLAVPQLEINCATGILTIYIPMPRMGFTKMPQARLCSCDCNSGYVGDDDNYFDIMPSMRGVYLYVNGTRFNRFIYGGSGVIAIYLNDFLASLNLEPNSWISVQSRAVIYAASSTYASRLSETVGFKIAGSDIATLATR